MQKRYYFFVALFALGGLISFALWPTKAAVLQQPVNTESGCASPSFTRADYPVMAAPYDVAVGDFNRDGKDDVATANFGEETVSIWLGDGMGKLMQRQDTPVGRNPIALLTGDFNRDGKLDLAVANNGSNSLSILLGDAEGRFANAPGSPINLNGKPVDLAAADFELDGNLDLAVMTSVNNTLSVWRGAGTGEFLSLNREFALQTPEAIVTGDFNRDGKPDLAVAHQRLTLWLNTSDQAISFGAAADISQPMSSIPSLSVADLDLDGNLDLVEGTNSTGAMFAVLWGDGAGAFRATTHFTTSATRLSVAVGDFNVDGKPDVVAVNSNNLLALAEGYVGWFGTPHRFTATGRPRALAVGDFNGDGNPDAITAAPDINAVSIFLNSCGSKLCSGIGFTSPAYFKGVMPYGMSQADFNRDGIIDLALTDASVTNQVVLMSGNREGGFARIQSYTAFGSPSAVVTADFNLDGQADLAVGSLYGDTVMLLLSRAAGGFAAPQALLLAPSVQLGSLRALVAADFNRDGKPDLAVAGYDGNRVVVMQGNGAGGFSLGETRMITGAHPEFLAAADFNRDGAIDLAVACGDFTVRRWLNNGRGEFSGGEVFPIGGQPGALIASDLDRNGTSDLVVTNQGANSISVLTNDGAGRFTRRDVASVPLPYALTVADFNRDGVLDLGITSLGLHRVAVQRGDGLGNFAAPLYFNAGITPRSLIAADFNQDGAPDLASANTGSNTVTVSLNDCLTTTDLAVQVQSPEPYTFPNARMDFEITVSNSGPDEARDAVITGEFSAFVNNPRWTCQASLTAFCGAASGIGNLNTTATLPPNTTVTFRVSATAPAEAKGNISFNAALAAAAQAIDPVTDNNSANAFTRIVITPTIDRITPDGAVVGSGDFTLTVEGDSFYSSSVVRWNGENRPTTLVSDRRLTANISAADVSRFGRARVSVWTATPVFAETRTLDFIIVNPVTSVSAASYIGNQLAVESFVSAFGVNLARRTMTAPTSDLPTLLGETSVFIRDSAGVTRAAPLFSISPGQLNYVMPAGSANGAATVQVLDDGAVVALGTVQITTVAPGLFASNGNGQGVAAGFTLHIKGDVLQSCEPVARYDPVLRRYVADPIDLGEKDKQVYLALSGTGIQHRSSLANVSAQIGGVAAEVKYAGAQGTLPGLDQINMLIPRSLAGRGEVFVQLTVDGINTNVVSLYIR